MFHGFLREFTNMLSKKLLLILISFLFFFQISETNIWADSDNLSTSSPEGIKNLQRNLLLFGFYCDTTGIYDYSTKVAVKQFKKENGLSSCNCFSNNYKKILQQKVAQIQISLNRIGFNAGPSDGICREKTIKAVKKFQSSNHLLPTGKIDDVSLQILSSQQHEYEILIQKQIDDITTQIQKIDVHLQKLQTEQKKAQKHLNLCKKQLENKICELEHQNPEKAVPYDGQFHTYHRGSSTLVTNEHYFPSREVDSLRATRTDAEHSLSLIKNQIYSSNTQRQNLLTQQSQLIFELSMLQPPPETSCTIL